MIIAVIVIVKINDGYVVFYTWFLFLSFLEQALATYLRVYTL